VVHRHELVTVVGRDEDVCSERRQAEVVRERMPADV
jgi:hypothetical protein